MGNFENMFTGWTGAYPEPMRSSFLEAMQGFEELYPLFGTAMVGSGDFGPEGLRFTYYFGPTDPEEFLSAYREMAGTEAMGSMGMSLEGPSEVEVAGAPLVEYRMTYDLEQALAGLGDEAAKVNPAELEVMQGMMDSVYGPDGLPVRFVGRGERMVMVMGGDADYVERALERIDSAGEPLPTDLARAFAEVEDANPCFVSRIDLGRFVVQMGHIVASRLDPNAASAEPPSVGAAPITVYGGAQGRSFSGGTSFDLGELVSAFETLDQH